jgi:Carboxylesterase family
MLFVPLQIVTLVVGFAVVICNPVSPIVCLEDGCVRGKVMPGYQTENFEAFLGIPFAQPPVGALRFQVLMIFDFFLSLLCQSILIKFH